MRPVSITPLQHYPRAQTSFAAVCKGMGLERTCPLYLLDHMLVTWEGVVHCGQADTLQAHSWCGLAPAVGKGDHTRGGGGHCWCSPRSPLSPVETQARSAGCMRRG